MRRSIFLIGAVLVAAASIACVATVPAPLPPQPMSHLGARLLGSRATIVPAMLTVNTDCSDADDFFKRIKVLKSSYDPSLPGQYQPPDGQIKTPPSGAPPDNPYNLRQEIEDDLKAAYNNAPEFFKGQLCKLNGIYLNPVGCVDVNNCPSSNNVFGASWGFRSYRQNASDNGLRYIAISASLWPPSSHALAFYKFSDEQLKAIIAKKFAPWTQIGVTYASPDDPWMTVLAALAHEYGHVRWADAVVDLRAPPAKPAGGPPTIAILGKIAHRRMAISSRAGQ